MMSELQSVQQAIRRFEETERDDVYGQMSSEPESNSGDGGHGQATHNQIELQDLEENKPEKHRPTSYLKRALVQERDDDGSLYNFRGFMFFCFGAPGVSPHWYSCLLFFYHVLLFTVGIGTIILGGISLALREEMSHTKQFLFADILSILAGTLYLLAAFYGGCIWTWRTTFLPSRCTRSVLPLSIIAWLLSISHVALVAAFVSVMINYGQDIISGDLKFSLNLLSLWTLGGLVVWACCFLVGMIPTIMLFRRKYRPRD